ncbi:hypothetical protein BCR34DRAFT_334438 [Clohesyomyces aquaticus]|uniref:Uncharacterized protein n=1 Tax=Clohesyomyces aquaticus TaxID=1231657 RepID=A0A1Y1ZLA6_9PLEO|nr:hypothetical protein BCR34DRAFT_334438 [Clohesyomyces aquaticus]
METANEHYAGVHIALTVRCLQNESACPLSRPETEMKWLAGHNSMVSRGCFYIYGQESAPLIQQEPGCRRTPTLARIENAIELGTGTPLLCHRPRQHVPSVPLTRKYADDVFASSTPNMVVNHLPQQVGTHPWNPTTQAKGINGRPLPDSLDALGSCTRNPNPGSHARSRRARTHVLSTDSVASLTARFTIAYHVDSLFVGYGVRNVLRSLGFHIRRVSHRLVEHACQLRCA